MFDLIFDLLTWKPSRYRIGGPNGIYRDPYQGYEPLEPYVQGEEAAAANGMTVLAVLAIVAVVVVFVLYMYNPDFHMFVTGLLARK
jgi:hypothetical protein